MSGTPRQMASLYAAAEFWLDRDEWPEYRGNYIGLGEPFCAGCGWLAPVSDGLHVPDPKVRWKNAGKFLDRAHLADHMFGGSGEPENLVPLCRLCHTAMPSFQPGQEAEALEWVKSLPRCSQAWQIATDTTRGTGTKAQRVLHAAVSA